MAQLDKIRLSGTTYDIVDATAIHSLDGYYTTGETNAAITAATDALAQAIAEQNYATTGYVQEAIAEASGVTTGQVQSMIDQSVSGKANSSDVVTNVTASTVNVGGRNNFTLNVTKGGAASNPIVFAIESGFTYNTTSKVIGIDTSVIAQTSDIPSVTGYADSVQYNTSSKYVEFYHGGTGGTKVYEFDASPFLIDGMVESVVITSVTSGGSEVTVLEITWNSAAGGQVTDIPLTEIFDASNYYTKSETSGKTEIANALAEKVNVADNNVEVCSTSTTTSINTTYANGATHAEASWVFDPSLGGYQFYSLNVTVENQTGGTQAYTWTRNSHSDVDDDKVTITLDYGDYDAYLTITPKGDYRIVSLVGKTIDEEEDISNISFTVSRCTSYGQSAEVIASTILPSLEGKADTTAVTQSITEAVSGKADSSSVYLKSETSGATEISTALAEKQATLVSGTNIKTVGGNSLLGSGNIAFPAGLTAEVSGTTLIFS